MYCDPLHYNNITVMVSISIIYYNKQIGWFPTLYVFPNILTRTQHFSIFKINLRSNHYTNPPQPHKINRSFLKILHFTNKRPFWIFNNSSLIISLRYLITHKEYCSMFVGMKHVARAALHLRHEKIPSRPISKSLVIPHLLFVWNVRLNF